MSVGHDSLLKVRERDVHLSDEPLQTDYIMIPVQDDFVHNLMECDSRSLVFPL